jgi:hypothetical protein
VTHSVVTTAPLRYAGTIRGALSRHGSPSRQRSYISAEGVDLRQALGDRPLIERKRRLRRIVPRVESRLLYVDHVEARGVALFHEACRRDLEGIVGKWKGGRYYTDGQTTSCSARVGVGRGARARSSARSWAVQR